jgi:hypothetical protein
MNQKTRRWRAEQQRKLEAMNTHHLTPETKPAVKAPPKYDALVELHKAPKELQKEYADLTAQRSALLSQCVSSQHLVDMLHAEIVALQLGMKGPKPYVYGPDEHPPVAPGGVCPKCGWTHGGKTLKELEPHAVTS